MTQTDLNRRCVDLFQRHEVQNHCWHPRMFWHTKMIENPDPEDLQEPKVDLRELEFLLATINHEASECASAIEADEPGRTALLRHMIERGDMPLLHRPH